jgi:hypothetical protein
MPALWKPDLWTSRKAACSVPVYAVNHGTLSSSSRGHLTYRQVCMLSILKVNKNDLPDSWLLAVLEFRNLSPVCV